MALIQSVLMPGTGKMRTKEVVHTVGISEMKVVQGNGDVLITYSLGSCMGLSLYDAKAHVGGLIHCMLPLSKIDKEKSMQNPCMFTDTGVMKILQAMYAEGASAKTLVAKVAGCAAPLDGPRTFKIGERNLVILRRILWKNNILIAAEDVGGTNARTMKLFIESGVTTIKQQGSETEL